MNELGEELRFEGLTDVARALPVDAPADTGAAMLEAVRHFSAGAIQGDDETLIVLQCKN